MAAQDLTAGRRDTPDSLGETVQAPDRRAVILIFALLTFAALLPLALVDVPPLVDLPNHLARLHIIANIETDTELARNYRVTWGFVPNLALEIVTAPLAGVLPAELLGRLFIGTAFLLLVGATLTLRRVLYGHVDLWTAAVFLFLYNQILVMGFVNYLFSLGLALFLFAGWIASRNLQPALRLALFCGAATGLFFLHFFALAVYAVCVGSYEIGCHFRDLRRDWRRPIRHWTYGALQFLPAAIIIFATMPEVQGREIFYGNAVAKLRAAWSPVLTYQKPIDLALLLFVVLVPTVAAARRKLFLAPALRTPLLFLLPLAVAMPFWVKGAWGAVAYSDLRLPIVIALLLVAGLQLRNVRRETLFALACAAAVLYGARIVGVSNEWLRIDREFNEFRAASAVIPRGASVLPVQMRHGFYDDGEVRYEFAFWHLPSFTVIDRAAFMPFLFTDATKQPVRAAPERLAIDSPFGRPLKLEKLLKGMAMEGTAIPVDQDPFEPRPVWIDWPAHFDYLLTIDYGRLDNPAPEILTPEHVGSYFTIYRIDPGRRTSAGPNSDGNSETGRLETEKGAMDP